MLKNKIRNKFSKYGFEIRHITVFFIVLILFQIILAFVQKSSLNKYLEETQNWYQKHSAERLAIITSTSMELLFENLILQKFVNDLEERKIISSFNVIVKQQLLQKSVNSIFLIIIKENKLYVIDSGIDLYKFLLNKLSPFKYENAKYVNEVGLFLRHKDSMKENEIIYSELHNNETFNILVPFVPDGEYLGVMYMKITPNFNFISNEVAKNFDNVSIIYSILIFIGLLAIFWVSSEAVKERNEARQKLFEEHEENIKNQVRAEKESLFTKRIYHTHHKAEKIIGFIKEDVRSANSENIYELKQKIITYSNFISRIIYDMKWYDQAINTIINPMFRTDINQVIQFIIDNIFLRLSSKNDMFEFKLNLDERIPKVNVNEFVVWEIVEPLIQNSIDHGNKKFINIIVSTKIDLEKNITTVTIEDDGVGVDNELLMENEQGIKNIFLENKTTKKMENTNSGYGCYIAYQMAVLRCGWDLDVFNKDSGGCNFVIKIKN
ncbi:MAG: ATP-binding protein [Ignavibacteriae bacterium]|nr:ATP-binding protein [Ignavibacteriota bacterium]